MLTIFTTPKRFKGHNGVIQRNAIKSWAMLKPTPQIIMFGSDEGNAEVAAELKITHVPNPETSEKGTPLISSMFGLAHQGLAGRSRRKTSVLDDGPANFV